MRVSSGARPRRFAVGTAVAAAGLALFTVSVAPAQEPGESSVVEHAEVRVVRVGLIALDAEDRPLTAVLPENLEARIRRQELDIAGVLGPDTDVRDGLPDVKLRIELGRNLEVRSTAETRPRYWVVFIDTDNDAPGKLPKVAESVGEFITDKIPPSDFVAVITYNGRIHIEQLFTSDHADAVAAVKQGFARPATAGMSTHQRLRSAMNRMEDCRFVPSNEGPLGGGGEPSGGEEDLFSNVPGAEPVDIPCISHQGAAYVEEMRFRSDSYYRALESGVRLAAGMPRGPSVLAVTHGVTIRPHVEFMDVVRAFFGEGQAGALDSFVPEDDTTTDAFDEVIELARREGVSLYFADPAKSRGTLRGARQEQLFKNQADPTGTAWRAPQADLQSLAEQTGGFFAADEKITPTLEEAVAREQARLSVDVYVPDSVSPEDLEDLEIRSRTEDVRIVAPWVDPFAALPSDLRVSGAAQLGETKPRPGGEEGAVQVFTVGVRQKEMDYAREGEDMVADLVLNVRVETADGRSLVDSPHIFRHSYPVDKWEAAGDAMLAVRGWFEAPPGEYRLLAEFRNARTRKTGQVIEEIRIP